MTCNRIDAIEAAVERVTAFLSHKGGNFLASINCDELRRSDLRTLLSALAEANERASLLQTAVHERCAERDEARKALAATEARRGELETENAKLRARRDEAVNDARTYNLELALCRDRQAALNPKQEGSRDHGK